MKTHYQSSKISSPDAYEIFYDYKFNSVCVSNFTRGKNAKGGGSHGVFSFSLAACKPEPGPNEMPTLFDFPTVVSVIPPVFIIEIPACSIAARSLTSDLSKKKKKRKNNSKAERFIRAELNTSVAAPRF